MFTPAVKPLDLSAFVAFARTREGKWELYDGAPIAMAAERARHEIVKQEVGIVFGDAIRRKGLGFKALVDTLPVRVSADRAFVPDVVVVCPPPLPDAIYIDNPLVICEVLSPSTAAVDHGIKLEGYFSLPSLAHYLILDADRRVVFHHKRGQGDVIETRILHEGALSLEPPGLDLQVADLFGPADQTV